MSVNALIFTGMLHPLTSYTRAIGAYRIANEIRQAGYTCQVVDFFTKFTEDELDKIISSFIGDDTLIIGFSTTFFEYIDEELDLYQKTIDGKERQRPWWEVLPAVHYPYHRTRMKVWFDKMRKLNPNIKIVLGGSKTRALIGPWSDAFAVGYCDQAIVGYMKFLQGKNPFFQYDKINETQIAFYGDRNEQNFDFSKTSVIWDESDCIIKGEMLPIEIARGCIFKCKFCSYPLNGKKKLDFVKDDNVLRDEFLRNYYEHGVTRYIYADDTHNDSIEKLERIHKIVTSLPFEIEYAAYLRHDLIHAHKETADLLRESGLRSAIFGIESLHHKSAKAIGKGLHPEKIKELLCWLKNDKWKQEVALSSGFIIGLPYDTPETVEEWAEWILNPSCPLDLFQFEPLYITRLLNRGKIWNSEFELNAESYGYTLHENFTWTNEHFTSASARALADKLIKRSTETDRYRVGGFPLLMHSNFGFNPKDLIGLKRSFIVNQLPKLTQIFVNQYKEQFLKRIENEISI